MRQQNQIEDKLAKVITRFYKDLTGTGPHETKVKLADDMVVVRLKNKLSTLDKLLSSTTRTLEVLHSQRRATGQLICPHLKELIEIELNTKLISCYSDTDCLGAEQVLIFVAQKKLTKVD